MAQLHTGSEAPVAQGKGKGCDPAVSISVQQLQVLLLLLLGLSALCFFLGLEEGHTVNLKVYLLVGELVDTLKTCECK